MGNGGSPFSLGGAVIGGAIGSIGAPFGGIGVGARWGATIGTLAGGLLNKPKDAAKTADAHWGGVTFGTSLPRGWVCHRTDCFVFWGVRNKDGSYLFKHDVHKHKKSGSEDVAHFHATFAFYILETGLTFPDGRQVERRIVVDRVWMADKIVWVNPDAAPLPAWSSTTTYYAGDFVSHDGKTWWCVGDANLDHEPGSSGTKQWWQKVSTTKNLNLHFHPDPASNESTFTMAASSVIASHDGAANTPAYRGGTYGVADDIDLYDLGNTLPFTSIKCDWHFADPDYTLGEFLSDQCGAAGMPEGSYDFSDITEPMPGYRQTSRQSGQDLVSSPLSVLGYDLATVDGVLRAIKRGGPIVATISQSELGATLDGQGFGGGDEGELIGETIPADRTELHSFMKLGYLDKDAGFRQSFESAIRLDHPGDNPTDLATDLVLDGDRAAKAVGYLLDTEHLEAGAQFTISLLGQRSSLCGGDPITVPWNGIQTRFRVVKTSFVQNLLKLTIVRDEPKLLDRPEVATDKLVAIPDNGQIVPTLFMVLSPTTDLSDDFARYPGFYPFANGPEGWQGAGLQFTFDPPGSETREWVDGGFVATESVFGTMTTALPDGGVGGTVPASPTGLAATAGNAQASLSWNAVDGASSYTLKRAAMSGGPYSVVQSGITGVSFTDTGLVNGTAYWYVVSASNAAGESADSGEVSATPSAPVSAPSAPASVVARGLTGRVGIDWSPSSGATSYTVKRGPSAGSYPDTIASGLSATTYTDTGRTNGTTYHYAVIASNSAGNSAPSADSSAVPIAQVTGVTATAGDKQVSLTWNDAIGATGYTVSYTASGGISGSKDVTSSSATILNLTNGTAYTFVVVGTNNLGVSDGSSPTSATPGASANPKVPQGGSATFAAPLQEVPAAGPPGWDVLNPSGTIVGTSASPSGWSVSYSTGTAMLTVGAPSTAPIATGYKARWFYTNVNPVSPHSAYFDVTFSSTTDSPGGVDQNPGTVGGGSTQIGG